MSETPPKLPFNEKCKLALESKHGDNWKNIKTGRTVIILNCNPRLGCVTLLHQSGRRTTKQHHYFAYEFEPLS